MADTRRSHKSASERSAIAARKKARQAKIARHKKEVAAKRAERERKKAERKEISDAKKAEKASKDAEKYATAQKAIRVLETAKANFKKAGQSTSALDDSLAKIHDKFDKLAPGVDKKALMTAKRIEKNQQLQEAIAKLQKVKTSQAKNAIEKLQEKIKTVKAAPKRDQTQEGWYKARHAQAGSKTGRN